jgi:tellurite resistance protein
MTRSVQPPRLAPAAPRPGLFRRTPPAIFPPILGLFGLGIAWRRGQGAFGLPEAPVEGYLGAVTLLFLFALGAYGAKVAMRPRVLTEDFRTLPGRAGLAALTMSMMMLAAVVLPYAPRLAAWLVAGGVVLHALVAAAALRLFLAGPEEARQVTPVMHLTFVGLINAPLAAVPLGMVLISEAILWYALAAALVVWWLALRPLLSGSAPAPLRPLQAIHLAAASLLGSAAYLTGYPTLGVVLAVFSTALFAVLVARARWLTEAGFSGFWSAFTFPIAAYAGLLFLTAESLGSEPVRMGAGLVLIAATLIIPPIAFKVMQLWAKGVLAQKTNAATA